MRGGTALAYEDLVFYSYEDTSPNPTPSPTNRSGGNDPVDDWIETFVELTEGLRSPAIFRRWAAITTIAGVLQRRVWTELKTGPCYPNLYIMLAGPPGSGKSLAIIKARELWATVQGLFIGPDNPTKASLVQRLSMGVRIYTNGRAEPDPTEYSSLAVPCEEFSNLITKYDHEFLGVLSHIWNNPPVYDSPRVSVDSYMIKNPTMTLIAGVTPDTLGSTFPEIAWGQGFTSRLIFIYSEGIKRSNSDIFQKRVDIATTALVPPLARMFEMGGEMSWSPEAAEAFINWLDSDEPPVPTHMRLKYYNVRRKENLPKLAMISAISAGRGPKDSIELSDFERAQTWLFEAERYMPDVFRAMAQKSDLEIVQELHFHISRLYGRRELAKRLPIPDSILWEHLGGRVPSMAIPRVIELAERGGWVRRGPLLDGRPTWIPRPLNEVSTNLE